MDHNVTHATFTLERSYPVPPARVFDAADHVGEDPAVPEHGDLQAGFRSGGHHRAGRGLDLRLDLRLEVSHPP